MKKVKLKIAKQAHLEVLFKFISNNIFLSGNKQNDKMINSILKELELKLYNKISNYPKKYDVTLKEYQAVALYSLYFEWSKTHNNFTAYDTNITQMICNQIHPKLL